MTTLTLSAFISQEWCWLVCWRCVHRRPLVIAEAIAALGDIPMQALRDRACCTRCGHRGAETIMRSWSVRRDGGPGFEDLPEDEAIHPSSRALGN